MARFRLQFDDADDEFIDADTSTEAVKARVNGRLPHTLTDLTAMRRWVDQREAALRTTPCMEVDMYVDPNFRSKKAMKEALAAGQRVEVYSPGPFPCPDMGEVTVEGPHFPEPHRWYARVFVRGGLVTKVLG